jgi:hypothetical protein
MDNKRKIGEEELKRALLMMKYDSRKTLTENVQNINEQSTDYGMVVGATAAGVGAGAFFGPPGMIVGGIAGVVLGLMNQTGSFENTAKIIESCKNGVGQPVMSEEAIRSVATTIYRSIEGIGTDEEGIRAALEDLRTFPDFCKMTEVYEQNYGESFGAALDDDFDLPSDWTDYIYTPLRKIVERTKTLEDSKLSADTATDTSTDGEVVTSPALGNYKPCSGTYTQGCYSESIKQIQTCLDLVPDGKFGPKTQAALEGAGFAGGFKDSDVDKICQTQTMPEPDMDLPTPDEDDIDSLNI